MLVLNTLVFAKKAGKQVAQAMTMATFISTILLNGRISGRRQTVRLNAWREEGSKSLRRRT